MKKNIILLGAGGHAKSCIDVIESQQEFNISGLIDSNPSKKEVLNYPLLGNDKELENLRKEFDYAFITIGQIKNAGLRKKLFKRLLSLDFQVPSIKSPFSYVASSSTINAGTIVMHGVIVCASSEVGSNCILNSKCLIEHDAKIANNCHIATGAIVNGGVKVGDGSFIGSGTVVKQGIKIGKNCVIGAGLFIKEDIKDGVLLKQ